MHKSEQAIAFDFDGTLIRNGIDKVPHGMYATYVACHATAFKSFLQAGPIDEILERLRLGMMSYPGAPRFQQLSAMVNSVVNQRPLAFEDPVALGLPERMTADYPAVQQQFNELYSALNDEANAHYWKPFPSVHATLSALAEKTVLYMASGVPQSILEEDLKRHAFNRALFCEVHGTDRTGQDDKQALLGRIKRKGYGRILFVGDTHKDQFYAAQAGVSFYRISQDADFPRLLDEVRADRWPDQRESWVWTPAEIDFVRVKTRRLVEAFEAGHPFSVPEASRWISA